MGREGGASIAMERDKTTLNVRHVTTYNYARPVQFGEHRVMMRPRDRHDQRLVSSELVIDPRPARLRWIYDAFDNCVAIGLVLGRLGVASGREPLHRGADPRRPAGRRN